MARNTKRLNNAKSAVIEENILKENPEGVPDEHGIVIAKEKQIPKLRKIVFINQRDSGYPLEFHYASGTHPLRHYKLIHGHEHELPEEVIEHLESCAERQYGYRKGMDGHPEMYTKGLKYLFNCRNPKTIRSM